MTQAIGFAAVLGALVAVPPFLSPFMLTLATQALIYAVLAMSLDLLLGYLGLSSLGHAAYLGLGAYSVGVLTTRHGANFWVTLGVGIALAVLVAGIFGLLALRATGVYFLMITLALGMVVWGLAHRWVTLTQGDNGISSVPRPLGLPWSLARPVPFYYFALAGFVLAFVLLRVIVRSPFGQSLVGIRESESRMRTLGYHVWLHKYVAFVIAGGVGGFAGVQWAYYNGFVSPADVELATSVEVLLMVALGGRGTLIGPALGAAVIVLLKNQVSVYTHRWLLILGAVYIGTIVYAPEGIVGAVRQFTQRRRSDMGKKLGALAVTLVVLATVAVGPAWAQPKGPIKIGFLAPVTGAAAAVGKDMTNGFQMYLDEIGGTIAGRKVEVIVEDTQGQPAIALTKLRKLVESDQVHVLAGLLFAHVGYALAPKVDEYKVPMLYPVVSADDLTQRKPAQWVIRMGWTSSQPNQPFGEWVAKTLKYKKVVTIGIDYAFGWEQVSGFQRTFEESGGQVVQKLWPPLGTTDFAPYLAQIRRDADAVFAVMVAASSLRFPKQYQDAGLKARLPLIGGGTSFDEFVLPSLGDEALGGISPLIYSAALDTPINRKFVKEYRAKFGKVPGYYSETCYTAARWINEGAKAVGGNVEDRDRFLTALKKVEIPDAPRGPIKLDAHGNPVQNIYVRKVERKDGELWNSVIHTFPAVSQFWKYPPDAFLKDPVYSRDYPPCKHC
jgi:branched-chain amino acid transport system substrate-binding protein